MITAKSKGFCEPLAFIFSAAPSSSNKSVAFYILTFSNQVVIFFESKAKSDGWWKKRSDQRRDFLTEIFRPSDSEERSGEGGDCCRFRSFRGFCILSRWPAIRSQSEKPILIIGRDKVRDVCRARIDLSRRSIFPVALYREYFRCYALKF